MADYQIKLEAFEGPIALLMHLIEKNRLDIYDIPIAEVAEQYLAYLDALQEFNIEVASEFIVMAATLLQIKSRMLLPLPAVAAEEDSMHDPREELVNRLIEYRKFQELSRVLAAMAGERSKLVGREPQFTDRKMQLPQGLDMNGLLLAFARLWDDVAVDQALIAREEISVQDKLQDIMRLLRHHDDWLPFNAILTRGGTRAEFVASFLALLELIKLNRIVIAQLESFAPIYLKLKGV